MLKLLVFFGCCGMALGQTPTPSPSPSPSPVASLEPDELKGFDLYPANVRALIEKSLPLTKMNLTYTFGSADPAQGGMDCSGTIYYVLREMGFDDVPRTASGQYVWARKADNFEAVVSRKMDSFELDDLRPGDLLFWTGTYSVDRDPPVTHTMIYLGERESDGKPVMFGASNGRSYDGKAMWGVSVFDFKMPRARAKPAAGESASPGSVFIGYATIPGLLELETSSPASGEISDIP